MTQALRFASVLLLAGCSIFDSGVAAISQQELLQQIKVKAEMLILDVRTPGEYRAGHIPGAFHIDHREIESRIGEISGYKTKPVIVYCLSGMRAGMVESYLVEQGFTEVRHLQGDWSEWETNKLPTE